MNNNRLATWRVEELGLKPYQTHFYSDCELLECEQCNQYYWAEVHADFCDKTCPQRYEEHDGLDLGSCHDCKCEHCTESRDK
jgi:hypothetical protein